MDELQAHQNKLANLHKELHDVSMKMKGQSNFKNVQRKHLPLSLFEQLSGKQATKMHKAEVRELFVAAKKEGRESESLSQQDVLNTFLVSGAPMDICQEATQHMMAVMDADQDGQISWGESMKFVTVDSAKQVSPTASSMLQKEASQTE